LNEHPFLIHISLLLAWTKECSFSENIAVGSDVTAMDRYSQGTKAGGWAGGAQSKEKHHHHANDSPTSKCAA
jgi:hypothetical protein